jgi:SAM-dependent methyltransferase
LLTAHDWSKYRIPDEIFLRSLDHLNGETPRELFASADDDFWLWALTAGRRESDRLAELLPGLPDEETQITAVGFAGDEALYAGYLAYRLFRRIYQAYGGVLEDSTVLDFGCGWGRVTRFFLKDVESERLWGVDHYDRMIAACDATSRWGHFRKIDPFPPIDFADNTFDLVICNSVFSHLSEEVHLRWVEELTRIMRPGGILIATTWARRLIERCQEMRNNGSESHLAAMFREADVWLERYSKGDFCFDRSVDAYGANADWHGETCIPETYVRTRWSDRVEVLDFIDDRDVSPQNVIVCRKPA